MADSDRSKAAKKNAKRRAAKKKKEEEDGEGDDHMEPHQMLEILKSQLENAKDEKDHETAGILRDQIWVLSDIVKGVRTNIPKDELLPILARIEQHRAANTPAPSPATATTSSSSTLTPEEKKIRALRKKLQQIEELKSRIAKAEKLEQSQLDKIASEDKIKEEIAELEELIKSALSMTG